MNFLSYFRETDNKRRRSKRIVINLLYLLIPVVILAGSFTNDRIITECEDIHHYNTELQQEIIRVKRECNTSRNQEDRQLRDEISRLENYKRTIQAEVDELVDRRAGIIGESTTLDEEVLQCCEERDKARLENDGLTGTVGRYEEEIVDLRTQLEICQEESRGGDNQGQSSSESDEMRLLKRRLSDLRRDYNALQARCNEDKYTELEEENKSLAETNADLLRRLDKCQSADSRSSQDYVEFTAFKENPMIISGGAEVILDANQKYAVEVNGKVLTTICTGTCLK